MKLNQTLSNIKARQILTSRGTPTVEVDFIVNEIIIRSSVPSGASTGKKEAMVKIDNGEKFNGMSVYSVVNTINNNKNKIMNYEFNTLEEFDNFLLQIDNTENKSNLGANFILPLSICCCKMLSNIENFQLFNYFSNIYKKSPKIPIPHFNVLNGGIHSGNSLACQEMMICFREASYSENLEAASLFYQKLKDNIKEKYGTIYVGLGDEGGFAPPILTVEEGLDLLISVGAIVNREFSIALDCAANEFFKNDRYHLNNKIYTSDELVNYYEKLVQRYPQIYSIEDPFTEDDVEAWKKLYNTLGCQINIVGDDLTVTNDRLIKKYSSCINTVLIKPNQIGSVSETIKSIETAKALGKKIMVSHRSGETEDNFICHLAAGFGVEYIKCGAPCRGERVCKYNELLRIEEYLNEK